MGGQNVLLMEHYLKFFSLENKMRCHKNSEDCKNLAKKFHVLANYKLPLAPSLQGQFHLKSSWNFKNNVLYLYKVQISSTKLASSTLTESWFGSTFCTVSLKLFLQYTHFDLTHTVWSFLWLLLEINLPFQKSNVLQFC